MVGGTTRSLCGSQEGEVTVARTKVYTKYVGKRFINVPNGLVKTTVRQVYSGRVTLKGVGDKCFTM